MSIAPAGIVVILLWLALCLRRPDNSVRMTIWMLPFGMFAVVALPAVGGLSLLAASVLAALSIGLATLAFLFGPSGSSTSVALPRSALWYGLFVVYAVISAVLLVRLFAGDFLVVPLSRDAAGVPIDVRFPTLVSPLWPGSSNISQAFYITLGFLFFVTLAGWAQRQGPVAGERALRVAAGLNAVLGVMDFLALDQLLDVVRTANYALANAQGMLGFARVIGGFSEPSAFGTASATFFAYFASAWVFDRRWANAWPALANGVLVVLAFAATGYFAAGLATLMLATRARGLLRPQARATLLLGLGTVAGAVAALSGLLLVTPLGDTLAALFESLFLEKGDSVSGLERATWARYGLIAFAETWGLGAGAGSIRSNGLIPVLLGSVGWPGTLFFLLFVVTALRTPPRLDDDALRVFASARLAALAQLAAAFVSGTVPDLGLIFVTVMGLAVGARLTSRFGQVGAQRETMPA